MRCVSELIQAVLIVVAVRIHSVPGYKNHVVGLAFEVSASAIGDDGGPTQTIRQLEFVSS